ncbi:MAG: hypothetical protein HUJ54_00675 [Erysipelotrichaceae bacterium]|nr:hypothetical protein [Erysipelotrichaceae bacterium]
MMKKPNTPAMKENRYRPAWVTPEILQAKRKSYLWMGASLLCFGAASVAVKMVLNSPVLPDAASLLPVLRNTALLLLMACGLIVSVIFKKADPRATRAFMIAGGLAAGTLSAVLLHTAPMSWFGLFTGLAVFLTACVLYLVYQAKYDPEDVDPRLLAGCPYVYIPFK